MRLGAVTHGGCQCLFSPGEGACSALPERAEPPSSAKVLPGNGAESLGLDTGGKKAEKCNGLRACRATGSFCLSCYLLLPSTFICRDKNPIVCLEFFVQFVTCIYIFFCFVLRRSGELLEGKQPRPQDGFLPAQGLVSRFPSRRNQFLELPVRRQRANAPLGFAAREKMRSGG